VATVDSHSPCYISEQKYDTLGATITIAQLNFSAVSFHPDLMQSWGQLEAGKRREF